MSVQSDFAFTIDRAANAVLDATCAARAAGHGGLPQPHRRLVNSAISSLERAQQLLYEARNNPWGQQQPKPRQLEML